MPEELHSSEVPWVGQNVLFFLRNGQGVRPAIVTRLYASGKIDLHVMTAAISGSTARSCFNVTGILYDPSATIRGTWHHIPANPLLPTGWNGLCVAVPESRRQASRSSVAPQVPSQVASTGSSMETRDA